MFRGQAIQIVDELWGNVGAHMWSCRYGIGILDTRPTASSTPNADDQSGDASRASLNSNVLIELGSMLTIGRRCMILKDPLAPTPPTDLTSHIYKSVVLLDDGAVAAAANAWIDDDLRLSATT